MTGEEASAGAIAGDSEEAERNKNDGLLISISGGDYVLSFRSLASIYNLKFIPLIVQVIMLIALSTKGPGLDDSILGWYWPVFLILSAAYFLLYSLELKKKGLKFAIYIVMAAALAIVSLSYLLRG